MLLIIREMVNHGSHLAKSETETHTSDKAIRKKQQFDYRWASAQGVSTTRANEGISKTRQQALGDHNYMPS